MVAVISSRMYLTSEDLSSLRTSAREFWFQIPEFWSSVCVLRMRWSANLYLMETLFYLEWPVIPAHQTHNRTALSSKRFQTSPLLFAVKSILFVFSSFSSLVIFPIECFLRWANSQLESHLLLWRKLVISIYVYTCMVSFQKPREHAWGRM